MPGSARRLRSALGVAVSLGWIGAAQALVFDLNCIIGNGTCTPSASYGRITIVPAAISTVSVTVDLLPLNNMQSNQNQRVQEVWLNFDPALSNVGWSAAAGGMSIGIIADQNGLSPGPYGRHLDLAIPGQGNLGFEPQTFTISRTGLMEADFNFLDQLGQIFGAVHIGACGPNQGTCQPGQVGNNSLFVGSTPGGNGGKVPEPGSLGLLGAALLGLLGLRRCREI